jgi:hypothetical protein
VAQLKVTHSVSHDGTSWNLSVAIDATPGATKGVPRYPLLVSVFNNGSSLGSPRLERVLSRKEIVDYSDVAIVYSESLAKGLHLYRASSATASFGTYEFADHARKAAIAHLGALLDHGTKYSRITLKVSGAPDRADYTGKLFPGDRAKFVPFAGSGEYAFTATAPGCNYSEGVLTDGSTTIALLGTQSGELRVTAWVEDRVVTVTATDAVGDQATISVTLSSPDTTTVEETLVL